MLFYRMQEVYKGIYKQVVELPDTPLRELNLYIVHSEGEALVIDTGFPTEDCLQAFRSSLSTLDIDIHNTRLFVTHGHADHCGLCATLQHELKEIYMGENEAREMIRMSKVPRRMEIMLHALDLEKYLVNDGQISDKFQFFMDFNYTPVNEGNTIKVG